MLIRQAAGLAGSAGPEGQHADNHGIMYCAQAGTLDFQGFPLFPVTNVIFVQWPVSVLQWFCGCRHIRSHPLIYDQWLCQRTSCFPRLNPIWNAARGDIHAGSSLQWFHTGHALPVIASLYPLSRWSCLSSHRSPRCFIRRPPSLIIWVVFCNFSVVFVYES